MLHPNYLTGLPCSCMWGRPDLEGFDKTAGQYFDELKQRKKLQNPQTQAFLHFLERNGYITDFSEKWTPWLLNQVKNERIQFLPEDGIRPLRFSYDDDGPMKVGSLSPERWQHWTDWLNSGHGTRQRAGNPEHLTPNDINNHVYAWDEDLKNKATEKHRGAGTPVHQFDDGWSIRELGPDELKDEGNAMGHCVGSYADQLREPRTMRVLSLRDEKGDPHVTTGIYYPDGGADDESDNGYIYQHYGKNNRTPKDEYNQRFKEYFSTIPMEQRPLAEEADDDNFISDHEDLGKWLEQNHPAWEEENKPGPKLSELGLPYEPIDGTVRAPDYDSHELHNQLVDRRHHEPFLRYERAENLYNLLKDHGDIPKYEKDVLAPAEEGVQDTFDTNWYQNGPPYSVAHWEQFPSWHPDNWDEQEWADWLNKTKQQDTPENRQKVMEDYEESEARERDEALAEWPEYQANNAMRELIAPHWNPDTNAYQQEPYRAMPKQANTFHYHPTYGHPCLCPWGGGERNLEFVGSIKVADKADWLRGRKDMQDPEAQRFLTNIERLSYPDKLMPWIVREWRKGRLDFVNPGGCVSTYLFHQPEVGDSFGSPFSPQMAKEWTDYAEEMKKHKKGIDYMQHTFPELRQRMQEAHDFLMEKKRPTMGEVLHRFDDGWTVRRLKDRMEAKAEGDDMGHCVGSYGPDIENGHTHILSLRDPNNVPHGTLELNPDQWEDHEGTKPIIAGSTVGQWYGHSNNVPKEEYTNKMNEYLRGAGVEEITPEEDPKWWEDEYQGYDVETPDEYVSHRNGDESYAPEEYEQACADAYEHDLDEPDLIPGETRYDNIVNELMTRPNNSRYSAEDVFDAAKDNGELNRIYDAWKGWHENNSEEEDAHPGANQVFQQEMAQHINPENGMFSHPRRVYTPGAGSAWETALDRWWENQKENYPQLPGADWGGQPMPEWARPAISAKVAASIEPLYHRWSLSPDTGHIELSHNHDGHPAEVDYHRDLAGKINRPNLIHGYAYRIPGGYRLTDWEHQPIKDPFVTTQVTRALVRQPQGDDWESAEPDFEKLHYGMPT